ncbi:MAG: hypothetical protein ABNH23_05860, partial [Tateyamaria sp.]
MSIDTDGLKAIKLPEGVDFGRLVAIGSDILLIQEDGTVVVLLGGAKNNFVVQTDGIVVPASKLKEAAEKDGDWAALSDVRGKSLFEILNPDSESFNSGEQEQVDVGDPLIGLPYNPLLPPTDYVREPRFKKDYFGDKGGTPPGETTINIIRLVATFETDSFSTLVPSQFIEFTVEFADLGEEITQVTLEIGGLPQGTITSAGQIVGGVGPVQSLQFTGTPAQFDALTLTFPTDFSSQSRTDFIDGPLDGKISLVTNFLGSASLDFPVYVFPEGDVEIDVTQLAPVFETDAAVSFVVSDYLAPRVDPLVPVDDAENLDQDGSEEFASLSVVITGLPTDVAFTAANVTSGVNPVPGGVLTVDPTTGASTYTVTLTGADIALYAGLAVEVPADFSTTNRSDLLGIATALEIGLELTAVTDEDIAPAGNLGGGTLTETATVIIEDTPDITLAAPPVAPVDEDADGEGNGVLVDLALDIDVTDRDLSEDPATGADPRFATMVEVAFSGLPASGATAEYLGTVIAVTDTSVLSLTVEQAEALQLRFPTDFNTGPGNANPVTVDTTVVTPEGRESGSQEIEVRPQPDIGFSISDIVTNETDGVVTITPSTSWNVTVSDPGETLTNITFTLSNLPAGVTFPAGGAITYDAVNGGAFSFSGTEAEYLALTLTFPRDFSTDSRIDFTPGSMTGTIEATSSDGGPVVSPDLLSVQVIPEGDVEIDVTQLAPVFETDAAVSFVVSDYLAPRVDPLVPV